MKSLLKALLIITGVGALFGVVMVFVITSRGISAKAEPGVIETVIARTMRGLAIPRGERDLKNPIANSDAVFASGLAKMQEMNPRSPGEIRAEDEMKQFLEGADSAPPAPQPSHGHGGR